MSQQLQKSQSSFRLSDAELFKAAFGKVEERTVCVVEGCGNPKDPRGWTCPECHQRYGFPVVSRSKMLVGRMTTERLPANVWEALKKLAIRSVLKNVPEDVVVGAIREAAVECEAGQGKTRAISLANVSDDIIRQALKVAAMVAPRILEAQERRRKERLETVVKAISDYVGEVGLRTDQPYDLAKAYFEAHRGCEWSRDLLIRAAHDALATMPEKVAELREKRSHASFLIGDVLRPETVEAMGHATISEQQRDKRRRAEARRLKQQHRASAPQPPRRRASKKAEPVCA